MNPLVNQSQRPCIPLYVLLNRTVLCNCIIEAESNFLLESIAACDPERDNIDLEMYFVANTAFINYFDELISTLGYSFSPLI